MHPNTRALVAVAAGRLTAGGTVGAVYDHSRLRYVQLSGFVSDGRVAIFDHERRCHFVGANGSFYDHGRGVQVLLRVHGRNFSGYDHGDGHHFSGSLNDGAVSVYDFGESRYFTYLVAPQTPERGPQESHDDSSSAEPEGPAHEREDVKIDDV